MSLHNKCKNTENEETKIPIFLSYHREEDRNKGAVDESKISMVSSFIMDKTKIRYAFMASIYAED